MTVGSPHLEAPNGQPTTNPLPLAVPGSEAARLCGISTRAWRRLNASGQLPEPVVIGASKRWVVSELEAWVNAGCPPRVRWEAVRGGKPGAAGVWPPAVERRGAGVM